jgi:Arc/MetJ-type ribon-helix-helix transcriptional regulator
MPRLSITLTDEQNERVEELVENGEYSSKNAVVQDWLADAEKVNQLESEVERLHRERRQLLEQRDEHQELALYAKEQRDEARTDKRRRQHNIVRRAWWAVAGEPADL